MQRLPWRTLAAPRRPLEAISKHQEKNWSEAKASAVHMHLILREKRLDTRPRCGHPDTPWLSEDGVGLDTPAAEEGAAPLTERA